MARQAGIGGEAYWPGRAVAWPHFVSNGQDLICCLLCHFSPCNWFLFHFTLKWFA